MKKSAFDKWKKLALSLAILIVLNIFFNVGLDTFYKVPEYDSFCNEEVRGMEFADTQEACLENDGAWVINKDWAYCESKIDNCWDQYQDYISPYNRNAFIALVSLGLVTLLAGLFIFMPSAVANGLTYGGILSIVIGTMRYWPNMDDYLRFIFSGIVLVILILVGFKKIKD